MLHDFACKLEYLVFTLIVHVGCQLSCWLENLYFGSEILFWEKNFFQYFYSSKSFRPYFYLSKIFRPYFYLSINWGVTFYFYLSTKYQYFAEHWLSPKMTLVQGGGHKTMTFPRGASNGHWKFRVVIDWSVSELEIPEIYLQNHLKFQVTPHKTREANIVFGNTGGERFLNNW